MEKRDFTFVAAIPDGWSCYALRTGERLLAHPEHRPRLVSADGKVEEINIPESWIGRDPTPDQIASFLNAIPDAFLDACADFAHALKESVTEAKQIKEAAPPLKEQE